MIFVWVLALPFIIILPLAILAGIGRYLYLRYLLPKIVEANAKALRHGLEDNDD